MAPRKSQSANLTSSSKTLGSSSIPSTISLTTSDTMVTPTTDVSELPSLPTESPSSTIENGVGNDPSNSTEIFDAPTKSGDGSDSRTAPIATEDPATEDPSTFSYHPQIAPLNVTVIDDPSDDIPASDESASEDPKLAGSPSSDLGTLGRTSSPPTPSKSEDPNRVGDGGLVNSSTPPNLAVSSTGTYNTAPLPFSPATSFTSEGTVYLASTFASTFETTLPNGGVMTTAKAFTTQVPSPSAEANANTNGDGEGERPRQNPGPSTELPTSSENFFQRPAAAAGVFVVVLLIVGSLVWMFLIIRRHRRAIATATKERKRPSYMYGSTGISPRDRRSYVSYESHNWPQRFERTSVDNAASTSQAAPAPNPAVVLQRRPSYASTVNDFEHPQMGVVFASPGSSIPTHHLVLRSQSQRGNPILPATSPPIPPRSPLRPWSPPARTSNVATEDVYYRGEYANAVASGSNQYRPTSSGLLVPSMLMPLSRNTSNQPSRRRASSSTSFHSHPNPVTSTPSPVIPQFSANIGPTSRNVVDRRLSDVSSYASAENPFRSSAYIVPSPTPSAELQGSNERLSNPFDDAESPPHSPIEFTYVREGGATQAVVLERGVSLRRNDSLRNRPEHTQNLHSPQGPRTAEWGSSGSEAASSSIHLNANASSRATSGYKVMERRVARASESISTAETSAVNSVHRIGSLDSEELFYNPALAVASPVRDNNPQFPEIRG